MVGAGARRSGVRLQSGRRLRGGAGRNEDVRILSGRGLGTVVRETHRDGGACRRQAGEDEGEMTGKRTASVGMTKRALGGKWGTGLVGLRASIEGGNLRPPQLEIWEAPEGHRVGWRLPPTPRGLWHPRERIKPELEESSGKEGRWGKNPGGYQGLECEVREDLS